MSSKKKKLLQREEIQEAVDILKTYGVKRVVLFGSAACGTATERSDLDLACEGLTPQRFFEAFGKLLSTLSVPVDLVDLQGEDLRPSIRKRIACEGVILYEAK